MRLNRIAIAGLVLLSLASEASAAPFCAVFAFGRQCYYFSLQACQQAAGARGACVVNDEEVRPQSSGAPFCVVQSFGAQCFYFDAQSCRQAAERANGTCAVNPNR